MTHPGERTPTQRSARERLRDQQELRAPVPSETCYGTAEHGRLPESSEDSGRTASPEGIPNVHEFFQLIVKEKNSIRLELGVVDIAKGTY